MQTNGILISIFSPSEIEQRTREAIKEVVSCDINNDDTLLGPSKGSYDFIISSLCLESACMTMQSYIKSVRNLCGLIKPGGKLFLNGVLGETFYILKGLKFFCLSLTQEEITEALKAAGMEIEFFDQIQKGEMGEMEEYDDISDYDGIFWLLAVKKP